tara:strand:+ start:3799 stop:4911 length:1113 start_codon:yes stop_codon:yes gene_type:complete
VKVLYFSYRYNPENPSLGSSLDYEFYKQIKSIFHNVTVFQPKVNLDRPFSNFPKRIYKKITGKKLNKFSLINAFQISKKLKKLTKEESFDLVFTIYPNPLCFYDGTVPLIITLDTTFIGQQSQWKTYSYIGMLISIWQERRVFKRAKSIITFSNWCKNDLINNYYIESKKIKIFPIPAAIPKNKKKSIQKYLNTSQIKLLIVAREIHRKGVDIAINIINYLNENGYDANLTICGLKGINKYNIKYTGPYDKSKISELDQYISHYIDAHLLIHPARFEAAGITPSEAAAYGTPTITNSIGGLETTVKNKVSGYVLKYDSNYIDYAKKIIYLYKNPNVYRRLCQTTFERYKEELNWDSQKENIKRIFIDAIR